VNEELQSVNEELHTVNAELQSKLQELSRVNADLDEVLATVDTGILVLDDDLKIRRFNQRATNFVRIVGHDAGRPLSHLSHSFAGTSILDDCARTAREHVGVERVLFSDDGARVLFRTKPIRSAGRDGVLVSFSDVTSIETLEDAAQRLNEAVEQLDSPVVLLDKEGSIIYANRCFSDLSRRDAAFLPGTAFVDLLDESSRSGFAAALEQVRAGKPWHGTSALDVPNSPPILEETRLRPLFSKTGSLIGVARFSAALPDLGRNVRILLVEDNAGDAMLVEERLRLDGVINHFQWVTSAEAALERLDRSSAESLPDLILIDLGLPLISGEELLRIVKSDVRYAHIAVAILTGADVAVREQALYDRGAVAIVRKPVDLDGFRQILRRLEGFWFSMVRYGSPSQDELERSSKVE
ncbi:MAG TPA: PAS domain-containing protein, partial [Polyangiaceae bacterium]|nr:PAS domain-containing protein [Polyangiaceae bacterium]